MRAWLNRSRRRTLLAVAGGSLFMLQGCDPAVRDTVLNGVGSAATSLAGTFIQAFIESLQAKAAADQQATTVRAKVDFAPQIFA